MRLSDDERKIIREVVERRLGPGARALLFGSRVDDTRRGGDIDLLIELPDDPEDIYALQRQLYVKLLRALEERPVDVLVVGPHTLRQPVHEAALREGVLL